MEALEDNTTLTWLDLQSNNSTHNRSTINKEQ